MRTSLINRSLNHSWGSLEVWFVFEDFTDKTLSKSQLGFLGSSRACFKDFTDKSISKYQLGSFGSLGHNALQTLINTGLRLLRLRSIPPTISPKIAFSVLIMLRNGSFSLHKPRKMGTSYPVPVPSFQHPGDVSVLSHQRYSESTHKNDAAPIIFTPVLCYVFSICLTAMLAIHL